jgi:hypothetical protein
MRALKTLVIVLGVLLVLGTIGLAVAIVARVAHRSPPGPPHHTIDLPPGAEIAQSEIAGDRLVLRLRLPGGDARVIVLDLRSGALVATLDLHEAKP